MTTRPDDRASVERSLNPNVPTLPAQGDQAAPLAAPPPVAVSAWTGSVWQRVLTLAWPSVMEQSLVTLT